MATRRRLGARILVYGLLGVGLLWTLGPIYWMIATSLKGGSELFTWPPTYLPTPPVLANYEEAFIHRPLLTYARNSAIVAAISTPLSVSLAALAAFGFGRYRFHGRNTLLF